MARLPQTRIETTASHHVEVQVKHRLSRIRSVIGQYAISSCFDTFLVSNSSAESKQIGRYLRVFPGQVTESRDVLSRNHKDVGRGLRFEIPKCDRVIALG